MSKPIASCRRIDRLRALAYDLGFTSEDARQFGKLTKTATWEALLQLYSVDCETLDTLLDRPLDNSVDSVRQSVDTVDIQPRDTALDTLLDNSVDSVKQSVDTVDIQPRDTALDKPLDNSVDSVRQSVDSVDSVDSQPRDTALCRNNSTFLDWVDVGQFIALALASVGVFVLVMNFWRQVNPLNLFPPVKVNIQIGAKL